MKENNERFLLKAKKWTIFDCFGIVFKASPVYASITILLCIVLAVVPGIKIFTTAGFVDTSLAVIGGNAEYNTIFIPLLSMFAMEIFPNVLNTVDWFVEIRFESMVTLYIEEAFINKKARIKYKYMEDSETQDMLVRAFANSGTTMVNRFYRILNMVYIPVQFVSIVSVVFINVWWSGITAVLIAIPTVLFAIKSGKEQYKAFSDTEKIERYAGVYHSILREKSFLEDRVTFRYSPYIIGRWHEKKTEADRINLKTSMKAGARDNSASILSWLMAGVILVSLVPALGTGMLSAGMFTGIMNSVSEMVYMIAGNLPWQVKLCYWIAKNLGDLTKLTMLEEEEGALDEPADMSGVQLDSIEFDNVSFCYPGTDRYILKSCSFKLNAGEHYAFVGINGAGKTTITKLLTRLYDNYEGTIRINGRDLRDYSLAEIKGLFSIVYQDFAKYQIEFGDNIKLGDVTKNDDAVMMKCVGDIHLDDILANLHSGVDTPLGKISENGVDLSGGEWQRLAIARSLYRDAPMKILDEPTAALDPIAESGIYELFREITKGKSAIFITHRLGAAKIADKILVIDDGRVAEFGSHKELMEQNGIYAGMFNTQKGWYED